MKKNDGFIFPVIKSGFLTLIVGLISVLLFAILVKFTALSDTAVKTTNQFIKILAVFIGCFFTAFGKFGWLKGMLAGLLGTFLLYSVFSVLSGLPLFSVNSLADMGFSAIIGLISGIISVNVRGKEKE